MIHMAASGILDTLLFQCSEVQADSVESIGGIWKLPLVRMQEEDGQMRAASRMQL